MVSGPSRGSGVRSTAHGVSRGKAQAVGKRSNQTQKPLQGRQSSGGEMTSSNLPPLPGLRHICDTSAHGFRRGLSIWSPLPGLRVIRSQHGSDEVNDYSPFVRRRPEVFPQSLKRTAPISFALKTPYPRPQFAVGQFHRPENTTRNLTSYSIFGRRCSKATPGTRRHQRQITPHIQHRQEQQGNGDDNRY